MMLAVDSIRMATAALAAYRLRSFLTLLGIAVGIAAVILLTSIGEGIHRFVLAEFSQFGTNVISIDPGQTRTGGLPPAGLPTSVRPLTPDDARALEHVAPVLAVTPALWGNSEVGGNGRLRRTTVYGASAAMARIFHLHVASGRFLPEESTENARPLAVLGARLKDELFGDSNALGRTVAIGTLQFRVVGVLASKGQLLGIDLDDTAYIPAGRALELYNRDGLMEIDVAYAEGAPADEVAAAVTAVLRARHGRADFTVTTQADMLRTLSQILDILTLAVGALGGISLLVGGIGIVTLMTIAVSERTAEIGLLLALGAPRRAILGLFLGEAVLLSALGGLAGLALGSSIAAALGALVPALPVHTPVSFVILAEAGAIVVGLAAGVLPARRAAQLDPVAALHKE